MTLLKYIDAIAYTSHNNKKKLKIHNWTTTFSQETVKYLDANS